MKSIRSAFITAMLAIVSLGLVGCGGQSGPPRYALSGTAHLADDKPIPVGEVQLEPDSAAGNTGPGSMAQIRDGKFSVPADQGVVGGKYIATILAFDGVASAESEQGNPLIKAPYVEKVELPLKDSTVRFKIK